MNDKYKPLLFDHAVPMRMYGVDAKTVDKLRRELKSDKQAIREWIMAQEEVSRRRAKNMQLHHVVPLSLGGDNNRGNLVLADPFPHKLIHEFLDMQERPFPRNYRYMLLPIFSGRVWTLNL